MRLYLKLNRNELKRSKGVWKRNRLMRIDRKLSSSESKRNKMKKKRGMKSKIKNRMKLRNCKNLSCRLIWAIKPYKSTMKTHKQTTIKRKIIPIKLLNLRITSRKSLCRMWLLRADWSLRRRIKSSCRSKIPQTCKSSSQIRRTSHMTRSIGAFPKYVSSKAKLRSSNHPKSCKLRKMMKILRPSNKTILKIKT